MKTSTPSAAMVRVLRCSGFAAAAVVLGSSPVLADTRDSVEVWVRSPGGPEAGGPRQKVDLGGLPSREGQRLDPQYGRAYRFRAIPVAALIEKISPAATVDLALLHFANGVMIPLPFRDAKAMARLDPWVARAVVVGGKARPLPSVTRPAPEYVDNRGIVFTGNKVVVAEDWHPGVAAAAGDRFSPWRHPDTLVGIELVKADAYYRQLDVDGAGPDARVGLEIFKQNCQFCHGARGVGAKFGWDFVEPVPVHKYRSSHRQLFWHIRYKRHDAGERGEQMPALKHMTETDAAKLWIWLKAVASKPMPPYAPQGVAAR